MKPRAINIFKNEDLHRIIIFMLAVIITFFTVISTQTFWKYSYVPGDIVTSDIRAPFEMEDEFATIKLADERKQDAMPVIIDKKDQINASFLLANTFFSFIYDLRRLYDPMSEDGSETYKRTLEDLNAWLSESGIEFSENQLMYLIKEINEEEYQRFLNVTLQIVTDITANDIQAGDLSDNILLAQNSYRQKGLRLETVSVGQNLMSRIIFVNRIIDSDLTDERRDKEYYVTLQTQRVYIEKGEIIARAGTVLSKEKYELLKNAGLIRESGIKGYLPYVFTLLAIIALYVFIVIYIKYYYKKIYRGRKEELMLLFLIAIVLVISRSIHTISPLLIPLYIVPMMIAILLELKLAIVINIVLTFILAMFVPSLDLVFTFFLGGTFAAMFVQNKKQRSRLSLSGFFAALNSAAIYLVISTVFDKPLQTALYNGSFVLISGAFSIIITVGLLPLFEIIFNMITPSKLLELSNPNQPLLKMLLMEAPGTYHHSLMVGNLAEEAAEKIGGNSLLARVGAYYHDIGKAIRPQYFTENQKNENPHDDMNPKLSSFVIVSHVGDGIKLAREHKLPEAITEFIKTHHGNTLTSYFYHKAKENGKDDKVTESDYRYTGPKPQTKEGAVVMLADSVEAAVKSLENKSEGAIEGYIRKIIKARLDEGQLDESNLTLKELDQIAKSFFHVLSGYYHTRIAYPEPEAKEQK